MPLIKHLYGGRLYFIMFDRLDNMARIWDTILFRRNVFLLRRPVSIRTINYIAKGEARWLALLGNVRGKLGETIAYQGQTEGKLVQIRDTLGAHQGHTRAHQANTCKSYEVISLDVVLEGFAITQP